MTTEKTQPANPMQSIVSMRTATGLLANNSGDGSCFYCSAPADNRLILSSTFCDWWSVAQPESRVICNGCTVSIDEKIEIPWKEKKQKTRGYSWLVQADNRTPYTKAHKAEIYQHLINPPSPPWAFAIAESGQKHLLYRTPLNNETEPPFVVQLEMEQIVYDPQELIERFELTKRVVAAVGHKGAANPSVGLALAGNPELAETWFEVYSEPLSRLAIFCCPAKEICENDQNT